jgi:hypothetical protein
MIGGIEFGQPNQRTTPNTQARRHLQANNGIPLKSPCSHVRKASNQISGKRLSAGEVPLVRQGWD